MSDIYGAALTVSFEVSGLERSELETLFHVFGYLLHERENAANAVLLDHAVSVDLRASEFEIEVFVKGATPEEANSNADLVIEEIVAESGGNPTNSIPPRPIEGGLGLEFSEHLFEHIGPPQDFKSPFHFRNPSVREEARELSLID